MLPLPLMMIRDPMLTKLFLLYLVQSSEKPHPFDLFSLLIELFFICFGSDHSEKVILSLPGSLFQLSQGFLSELLLRKIIKGLTSY